MCVRAAQGIIIIDSNNKSSRAATKLSYQDLMAAANFTLILRGDNEYSYRCVRGQRAPQRACDT